MTPVEVEQEAGCPFCTRAGGLDDTEPFRPDSLDYRAQAFRGDVFTTFSYTALHGKQVVGSLDAVLFSADADSEAADGDWKTTDELMEAFFACRKWSRSTFAFTGTFLYVTSVQVHTPFRGRNLGLHMMHEVAQLHGHMATLVLLPCPMKNPDKKGRAALKRYWKRLGKFHTKGGYLFLEDAQSTTLPASALDPE